MRNPLIRAFVLAPPILLSVTFVLEHTILPRSHNPEYHSEILSQSRIINDFPISPHFNLKDFISPDTQEVKLVPYVVYCLEKLQKRIAPEYITINSGYRTSEHNEEVNGAMQSYHLKGMAVDCYIPDFNLKDLARLGLKAGFSTAIVYPTHVHFDIRRKGLRLRYGK